MTEKLYCVCCGKFAPGGLKIYGLVICRTCENKVARLKVEDQDYGQWVTTIRSFWEHWEEQLKDPS